MELPAVSCRNNPPEYTDAQEKEQKRNPEAATNAASGWSDE
jgi:hypothetical protein